MLQLVVIFLGLIFFHMSGFAAENSKNSEQKQSEVSLFTPNMLIANNHYNVTSEQIKLYHIINFNYQYYDKERKNAAQKYILQMKIKDLPLEQRTILTFNLLEQDVGKAEGLVKENFLERYKTEYINLSRTEKIDLLRKDLD